MLTRLVHFKGLLHFLPKERDARMIPRALIERFSDCDFVSFRRAPNGVLGARRVIRGVNATSRFLDIHKERPLIFYAIESDSLLAPHIVWDIAHALPVGVRVAFMGDAQKTTFLDRPYYQDSFVKIESRGLTWYEKRVILPAQKDAGLERWTFGIPVGPEDATILNRCVERILELPIAFKEILLCGRPAENFLYWDKVRIVGEDIPAYPLRIGAKKNRLVQEATYGNVCLLHDRVFLPGNFFEAMQDFGDYYPLTTFQSLWFDDHHHFSGTRYSDIGVTFSLPYQVEKGLMRDVSVDHVSVFSPTLFHRTNQNRFYYGNALSCSQGAYPTGSLYLCKKSVWQHTPQSEELYWIEFEDVEHGLRAMERGIPTKVNPYAVTQSMISRPLLNHARSGAHIEQLKRNARFLRAEIAFVPVKKKPLIRRKHVEYLQDIARFLERWGGEAKDETIPSEVAYSQTARFIFLDEILHKIVLPRKESVIRSFVQDFVKLALQDQMPYDFLEKSIEWLLTEERVSLSEVLLYSNPYVRHQFSLRTQTKVFPQDLSDYFVKKTPWVYVGTFCSALRLWSMRKRYLYLKGTPLTYIKAILESTPWKA